MPCIYVPLIKKILSFNLYISISELIKLKRKGSLESMEDYIIPKEEGRKLKVSGEIPSASFFCRPV
jgi:hypothetical protein